MRIHFIAIGGSVMHHLAITVNLMGHTVTGSDDEIYEPAKSNLQKYGLLPGKEGWQPDLITEGIDAIILGMHAREDNPELEKARKLGLKIYSYPEYIYERSKDKKRVAIAGSHGKTTITSMVMHVLKYIGMDYDYLVGAQLKGFERMVRLTKEAPVIIIEADEYLASTLERKPKFLYYKPHVALLSGIAWDHINAFPTFENYVEQFKQFLPTVEKNGIIIYNIEDVLLKELVEKTSLNVEKLPYATPSYEIEDGVAILEYAKRKIPLKVFGRHNLSNMEGARKICASLGVSKEKFYEAIRSFEGAAKRLEKLVGNDDTMVFKDFAHSPSKVKATIHAVKELYPDRQVIACFELHTYSSLNKDFLREYEGTMNEADEAIIFLDQHALNMKRMTLEQEEVEQAFDIPGMKIFTEIEPFRHYLHQKEWKNKNLLLMSSGNFGKTDLNEFAKFVIKA